MPLTQDLTKFTTGTQSVATYDYKDLAAQTGYRSFYPMDFQGGTYALSTQENYSDVGYTKGAADIDFDLLMKTPETVKGDVIVNIPCLRHNKSGGSLTIGYTATVYIRKWDGTTETDLGNAVATESISMGPTEYRYKMNALKVAVAETHFAEGDTLRVSVVFVQTGSEEIYFGHDPIDRTVTNWTEGPRMKVDIPFRIET